MSGPCESRSSPRRRGSEAEEKEERVERERGHNSILTTNKHSEAHERETVVDRQADTEKSRMVLEA